MFFLILLGWPSDEKNHAAFVRNLREFSRAGGCVVDRVEARALTVGLHSVSICPGRRISTMDMRLDAPDQAFTLTFEMHRASSRFGDRRNVFDRALMLTCRIHSLSNGVGRWISTSGLATRSIGGSSSPLEFTALRVGLEAGYSHRAGETFDRGVTLTVEIHSLSSGFGDGISTSALAKCSTEDSLSPLTSTAFRVAPDAGNPHRIWRRIRSRTHPHL